MTDADERLGTTVGGKYRITNFLAAGGMGAVYEAVHVVVKRRFAVKFLRADLALRRDVLLRFQREAEAAGALESENIAAAVDFGIAPDGAPFIVMEYLAGLDLARLLALTGPLPVERATDLVLQACGGIQQAHAAGVIHRDLKPENLFLCRRSDGSDLVKIVDFGIAKLQASDAGNAVTRTGGMLGTPSYMSPEQARGDAAVDPRSDVYSLGVILYELLCGQVPHPGDSYNAVIYHISTQAALPLARSGTEFSRDLVEVLDRALTLAPTERYETAEAFAQALAPFARRVVWAKVAESVPPAHDRESSPDPVAHELAATWPASTEDKVWPRPKSSVWRMPVVVATGLGALAALIFSVNGLSQRRSESNADSAARTSPNSVAARAPMLATERTTPVESTTAAPAAVSSPALLAPAPIQSVAIRGGRPPAPRGRPEGRPTSSVATARLPAAVKSAANSSGQATFDPRNPYE